MIPEYTLAGLAWLAGAFALAAAAGVLRERRTWLALGVFLAFTVVFDAVLTGIPIVTYGEEHLTGLRLGTTPVEDYLYGLALCLAAIAAHELARRGRGPRRPRGATIHGVPSVGPGGTPPSGVPGAGPASGGTGDQR